VTDHADGAARSFAPQAQQESKRASLVVAHIQHASVPSTSGIVAEAVAEGSAGDATMRMGDAGTTTARIESTSSASP
jgi:hypothetical protein